MTTDSVFHWILNQYHLMLRKRSTTNSTGLEAVRVLQNFCSTSTTLSDIDSIFNEIRSRLSCPSGYSFGLHLSNGTVGDLTTETPLQPVTLFPGDQSPESTAPQPLPIARRPSQSLGGRRLKLGGTSTAAAGGRHPLVWVHPLEFCCWLVCNQRESRPLKIWPHLFQRKA